MPWVNGGGETTELYAHVAPGSSRFLWRISMADVTAAGPFSLFAGYDRILVLIDGRGLSLACEDGSQCELQGRYDFVEFPGDITTFATVHDGPVRDFNVIADRSQFKPTLLIVNNGDRFQVVPDTKFVTIYAVECDVVIDAPNHGSRRLSSGDLLVAEDPDVGDWSVSDGVSIVVLLHPV
ncbi:MAG TPA: HutD family protein [Woeseiaceae bacterium]|nr:HutD family protein [Woeseiaceae bacterium]